MPILLILVIIIFAAAGGFLGDLLKIAGWLILVLVLLGAGAGFFIYQWVRKLLRP